MKVIVQKEILFRLLETTTLPKELKKSPEKAFDILKEKYGDSLRDKVLATVYEAQDAMWHDGILYSNFELSIRGERENKKLLKNKVSKLITKAYSVLVKKLDIT